MTCFILLGLKQSYVISSQINELQNGSSNDSLPLDLFHFHILDTLHLYIKEREIFIELA